MDIFFIVCASFFKFYLFVFIYFEKKNVMRDVYKSRVVKDIKGDVPPFILSDWS